QLALKTAKEIFKSQIDIDIQEKKLVPLAQLFGTWEVDVSVEDNSDFKLYEYGVCTSHFNFDNSKLHNPNDKKKRNIDDSDNCAVHSWKIAGRNVQVPCLGLKSCTSFTEIDDFASGASSSYRIRYICTECFETCGGHLHICRGSGNHKTTCAELHKDDTALTLKLFAKWILKLADSGSDDEKKRLICHLTSMLNSSSKYYKTTIPEKIPSLLLIKIAMKSNDNGFDNSLSTEQINLNADNYKNFGEQLGITIWNSCQKLGQNISILENPTSLNEYHNAFPKTLTSFFNGLIGSIKQKKHQIAERKRRQNGTLPKVFDCSS
ncbi:1589_t:CDS:2, partial [Entrophospora sp. SA101]